MNPAILSRFDVQKDQRTITVERNFHAPLDAVWAAWTHADILCEWWAPKPYECVIKTLDFRAGGRWIYCMAGPQGDRHWAFFDYETVTPKSFYAGTDGFCDEHGVINANMPRMKWENRFSADGGSTVVRVRIKFNTAEDLENIIKMGFKEGFSMGLDQLERLLAE